jgi:hypothetical protein
MSVLVDSVPPRSFRPWRAKRTSNKGWGGWRLSARRTAPFCHRLGVCVGGDRCLRVTRGWPRSASPQRLQRHGRLMGASHPPETILCRKRTHAKASGQSDPPPPPAAGAAAASDRPVATSTQFVRKFVLSLYQQLDFVVVFVSPGASFVTVFDSQPVARPVVSTRSRRSTPTPGTGNGIVTAGCSTFFSPLPLRRMRRLLRRRSSLLQ